MQLKVWRIENLRISKFEVQRVQNRGLDGFLAALRTARRSWDHPGPSWRRLGAVRGALWVRLGGAWRPSLGRLGVVLEAHEAIRGRRGASNGGRTKHSMLLIDFE